MSRTRVRRRRLGVTVTLAVLGGLWVGPVAGAIGTSPRAERVARTSVVVSEGDTLWSIARRLDPAADPRPLVDEIAAVNRIDPGSLVPGQTLLVPTP